MTRTLIGISKKQKSEQEPNLESLQLQCWLGKLRFFIGIILHLVRTLNFPKKLAFLTTRYTQRRLSLILFRVRSKHWMSPFTDKREGGNLQMLPKNTLKVFSEDNHYISAIVIYIFLICIFLLFLCFSRRSQSPEIN